METDILTFVDSNWQNIIIALVIGLIFFLLSNYAIKKIIISGEKERLKQAKNMLLDILEARIINKQNISLDKINNLLYAIEREHSVKLSNTVSPTSLLQDLELQFEKSHHLDPNQKEEYCKQIQNQIQEIKGIEGAIIIPNKFSNIVETLSEDIKSKNTVNALKKLDLLKNNMEYREEQIYEEPESMKIIPIIGYSLMLIVYLIFLVKNFDIKITSYFFYGLFSTLIVLILIYSYKNALHVAIKKC